MAMTEDLSVFFDEDDHAVSAVLDGGVPFSVLFNNEYAKAFGGVSTREAIVTAPTANVTAATTSSTLVVSGSTYRVRSAEPDGTGISRLLLELQ